MESFNSPRAEFVSCMEVYWEPVEGDVLSGQRVDYIGSRVLNKN